MNQFNRRTINRKCAYDRQASIQTNVLNSFVGQYLTGHQAICTGIFEFQRFQTVSGLMKKYKKIKIF